MTNQLSPSAVHELLYELCVDLGFCLPPHEQRRLREAPPADADEFTDAVFRAEGLDPNGEDGWLRPRVRDVVERHMRGE
ncbi:hypothetical protein ACH4S9_08995 [Streptomyces sp. NPDC021225]|uniref:hypothetical protein n=1 Tax=Streptomyces sp. NPDC021225 TaxID=3365121 RepID=UPI00378BCA62